MADLRKRQQKKSSPGLPPVWLFTGAALLVILGVGLWLWSTKLEFGPGDLGPKLSVNAERLDFGNVVFDKMVRAEFVVTNAGDRTLTLDTSTPVRVIEGC